jgi:hypothetical protein
MDFRMQHPATQETQCQTPDCRITELHSGVISIPASYSEDPEFDSQPKGQQSQLRFFVVSTSLSK